MWPVEVLQLRDTVFAKPCRILQKTVFAVTCCPKEWGPETPMYCLSGPEARLAVLLSVHRDAGNPSKLAAWTEAVTSAAVEFRRVADKDVVAEYLVTQEALNSHNLATLLTVPRRVLLVGAVLREHEEFVAGSNAVAKLYSSRHLQAVVPKAVASSDFQPHAQLLLLRCQSQFGCCPGDLFLMLPCPCLSLSLRLRIEWLAEIAEHVFSVSECLRLILEERPESDPRPPTAPRTNSLNGWPRQMNCTGICPSSTVCPSFGF